MYFLLFFLFWQPLGSHRLGLWNMHERLHQSPWFAFDFAFSSNGICASTNVSLKKVGMAGMYTLKHEAKIRAVGR